jgi:DNA polymerase III epsilon subunit-like protein
MPKPQFGTLATRLNVANGAAHLALSDARLFKEIFLAMLKDTPTVKTTADVTCVSQPPVFADVPICAIDPPTGFEALAMAMTER